MSFDRLHPALQHHIVNSLGWTRLRDLQYAAIRPIVAGDDVLVVGPTAGGKTEAAVLPVVSRMLTEDWQGLSVVYVCPLRALANDLDARLQHLLGLVGRSAATWHGDVPDSKRKAILREPPELLITTPESLEVMLVSRRIEHRRLFRELRAVVVDEIHAFGGDDRGWHLLAVLARIERLIERRLQRIGLSATVGNPESLIDWLCVQPSRKRVVRGDGSARRSADLRADFVGSLHNAALVIAGLHRGEKRLVFCDSRGDVERLAAFLRSEGVDTFVSHSSLSRDERRRAEGAFAEGRDCVIVATSTLELGIDVGDLDRVIQIDAPTSVASFLQRMGRTGRRDGTTPNTLFLTTRSEYLLRALGLSLLWHRGYVEPIHAPGRPLHIVAQQLLALCLQESRVGENTWFHWLEQARIGSWDEANAVASHMRVAGMLETDQGMLFVGETAEQTYGRRNFRELLSVFTTPPLMEVRHGREHLGSVHESSFLIRDNREPVLLLAGRSWALEEVDWQRRLAYVVPVEGPGDSRWIGSGQAMGFELCRAMREVASGAEPPIRLSTRAASELAGMRRELEWVSTDATTLATVGERTRWWTFAGTLANFELEWRLGRLADTSQRADELSIPVNAGLMPHELKAALAQSPVGDLPIDDRAVKELKFNECLERGTATAVLRVRARDSQAVEVCATEPISAWVLASGP